MNIELFVARMNFSRAINRAEFYEDMASAMRDGQSIVTFLEKRALRAQQMKDPLGPLYRIWLHRMNNKTFAGALQGDIPQSEFLVLQASEQASRLVEDLHFLSEMVVGLSGMKTAVIGSMIGPSIIFMVVTALLWGFSYYFVPLLTSVIAPDNWPASGKLVLGMANFTINYGLITLIVLIVMAMGITMVMQKKVGSWRRKIDDLPLFNLYRAYHGATMLISMAALMGAGASLVESLTKISSNSNTWVRWQIYTILRRLDTLSGDPGKAFDTGLLPRRILNRVIDRAERTDFGEALQKIGITVIASIRKEVETKAKMLNVVMVLLAGVMMGALVYGFLDTVYSIQNSIKQY